MMKIAPTLQTERLILRSFTLEDAADVQHLIDDPDMASTTDEIEYPYEEGTAEEYIQWCYECFEDGGRANFAVTLKTDGTLIGQVGLNFRIHLPYKNAELGYWIGKPYWNCGYCTEAAKAVLAYGFANTTSNLFTRTTSNEIPLPDECYKKSGCTTLNIFRKIRKDTILRTQSDTKF